MSLHSESESEGGEGEVRQPEVWQTVVVSLHSLADTCPLLTLQCAASRFLLAEHLPAAGQELPRNVATVMFRTFCCFGFPRVELCNFLPLQAEQVRWGGDAGSLHGGAGDGGVPGDGGARLPSGP